MPLVFAAIAPHDAHDAKGPYGFSPASKEIDDRVVDLVKRDAADAPRPTYCGVRDLFLPELGLREPPARPVV